MGCTSSKSKTLSAAVPSEPTKAADLKNVEQEVTAELIVESNGESNVPKNDLALTLAPGDIISFTSDSIVSGVVGGVTLLGTGFDIVTKRLVCGLDNSFEYKANRVPSDYKILHFVRHAEGLHNVAEAKDHSNIFSEEWEDAVLSDKGISQCAALDDEVNKNGLAKDAQLLVVSPMRRTLQTATLSFPSLIGKLPWLAHEALREQSGSHPCDRRRPKSELAKLFPNVDFDQIESELDPLYPKYGNSVREPDEAVAVRGSQFLQWLASRSEREIIIVTHSAYLRQLLGKGKVIDVEDSSPETFANCEMRTYSISLSAAPSYRAEKTE